MNTAEVAGVFIGIGCLSHLAVNPATADVIACFLYINIAGGKQCNCFCNALV